MVVAVSGFGAGRFRSLVETRTGPCSQAVGMAIPLPCRNAADLRNSSERRYWQAGAGNGCVLVSDVCSSHRHEPTRHQSYAERGDQEMLKRYAKNPGAQSA